jgi:hypothetical protein
VGEGFLIVEKPSGVRLEEEPFSGAVGLLSLILSIISILQISAATSSVEESLGILEINTMTVATELDKFQKNVARSFSKMQTINQLVQAESFIYQSLVRTQMTMQDNLLSFQATISSASYGMLTNDILSTDEIRQIANQVMQNSPQSLDMTLRTLWLPLCKLMAIWVSRFRLASSTTVRQPHCSPLRSILTSSTVKSYCQIAQSRMLLFTIIASCITF